MTRTAILFAACLVGCGRVNYSATDTENDAGVDAAFLGDANIDAFAFDASLDTGPSAPDAAIVLGPLAFDHFIKASNTEGEDEFGTSIAVSADGNTLAVGAIYEDSSGTRVNPASSNNDPSAGAVYVYARSGATWVFQAFIKSSNTNPYDEFGRSVSLSADGNTLAVGAPNEDGSGTGIDPGIDETASESGAVYLYTRSGSTWTYQAYIKANNTGAGDRFGSAVALSSGGDLLAVGAPGEDSSGLRIDPPSDEAALESGAVYLYAHTAPTWTFLHRVKSDETARGGAFGSALAMIRDGAALVVGAPEQDGRGTVYVFDAAPWHPTAVIHPSNPGSANRFGRSLAANESGRTLAIGADGEATAGTGINPTPNRSAPDTGAAYIFQYDGTAWAQQAFIKASNASVDHFAWSLALDATGDYLVVGSIFEDGNGMGIDAIPGEGVQGSGAAYAFIRRGTTWEEVHYIKAFNAGMSDHFGGAVAMSGDGRTLAIGASLESSSGTGVDSTPDEGAAGSGAVYLYR